VAADASGLAALVQMLTQIQAKVSMLQAGSVLFVPGGWCRGGSESPEAAAAMKQRWDDLRKNADGTVQLETVSCARSPRGSSALAADLPPGLVAAPRP
jgi:hypothetical protein